MTKADLMEKVLDHYDVRYNPTRNGWQSIHCPNQYGHKQGDKNPSARVNMVEGAFACMGCMLKGDAYSLVMGIEGLTFPQAKEQLGSEIEAIESDYLF